MRSALVICALCSLWCELVCVWTLAILMEAVRFCLMRLGAANKKLFNDSSKVALTYSFGNHAVGSNKRTRYLSAPAAEMARLP